MPVHLPAQFPRAERGHAWLALLACALPASPALGSDAAAPDSTPRFALRGYGTVNYFAFDWDTDPGRRNAMDLERLTLYPSVRLAENVRAEAEIEFEHGGTGATMEFDRFEEFGEFEAEIEKGGEVLVEQLRVDFAVRPAFNVRAGRFKIPVGLACVRDEPSEYFTTTRSEAEASVIPVNWYENGVQVFGAIGAAGTIRYSASVVNGLDATGFSSASWVARGHQKRFETVNAEDLALTARLDVDVARHGRIGGSIYRGDSADNRPKPDLDVSANVTIGDVHGVWETEHARATAVLLYGTLENADEVSRANRNLSNNLNVKRTPVGSEALAYAFDLGYDVASLVAPSWRPLFLFVRHEFVDSMSDVEGDVFDNPRWERRITTGGLNYRPARGVAVKAQYSHRELGTSTQNNENTFSTGIGFEF